eukprot:3957856-Pleurochrysis_carterae.AAC.1
MRRVRAATKRFGPLEAHTTSTKRYRLIPPGISERDGDSRRSFCIYCARRLAACRDGRAFPPLLWRVMVLLRSAHSSLGRLCQQVSRPLDDVLSRARPRTGGGQPLEATLEGGARRKPRL